MFQVNSGDTIVLKGRPRGGPPPERNISLAFISAPKLGRRPIGNEEATVDEVFFENRKTALTRLTSSNFFLKSIQRGMITRSEFQTPEQTLVQIVTAAV